MDAIERVNWLAHRWPISHGTFTYGTSKIHVGKIEGQRVAQKNSRKEYDLWAAALRPVCLARFIAGRPKVHPAVALIVAGEYRLGRIPPELWCGYDTVHLLDLPDLTLLSAKVRAMYPAWPKALIRVVRSDQLGQLGLRAAPDARGPKLRLVA